MYNRPSHIQKSQRLWYDVTTIQLNSQRDLSIVHCGYYTHGVRFKGIINLVPHFIILVSVSWEELKQTQSEHNKPWM